MKKIILTLLLVLVVSLSGCINVSDDALDKVGKTISENTVVCNEPYMRLGDGCCLDQNQNKICDKDEQLDASLGTNKPSVINNPPVTESPATEPPAEDSCKYPYSKVNGVCCMDHDQNNICDVTNDGVDDGTDVVDENVGSLQLDSVTQLTNYDQIIHRAPEYASISGDGSKISFFRFTKYVDADVAYPIRNAVYVANTNSLNDPKLVFESGTVPSVKRGDRQYYYMANVRGSTALSDDGKYVYFVVSDSINTMYFSRVNTVTKAFELIKLSALSGYVETKISNFHIDGNKIYYTAQLVKDGEDTRDWIDTASFSMNLDGSNQVMLAKTIAGEYPNIFETTMLLDTITGKLYFEGQVNKNIDGIYYIENGEFKKVGLSEELGDNGLLGVYNGDVAMFGSEYDFSYNVNSGEITEFAFDMYPRSFMSDSGNVIFGKVGFSNYNFADKSLSLIIGHEEEDKKYRDLSFSLVNTINPYCGEVSSSDGKTILVQEEKTGFGNYYVLKLK